MRMKTERDEIVNTVDVYALTCMTKLQKLMQQRILTM